MIIRISVMLSFLLLAGCSTLTIQTDYNPEYDFSAIKTYQWVKNEKHSDDVRVNNSLIINRVNKAINQNLQSKGLTEKKTGEADVFVNWFGGIDNKIRQETINHYYGGMYRGYGYPYGGYWPGYTQTYNVEYQEGTLIIDILDGKSHELIWRGTGQDYVEDNQTPEEITQGINQAVEGIMESFPPGTQKK